MRVPTESTSLARVRFAVDQLEFGMFIAELDRPWLDTPFLLQGLLLRTQDELRVLRQHSRFVYVDINRSSGAVAQSIRRTAAKNAAARAAARRPVRLFARLFAQGRDENARSGRQQEDARESPLGRLKAWLSGLRGDEIEGAHDDTPAAPDPQEFDLPASTRLRPYPSPTPIHESLPKATQSFTRSADTLRTLADDLRSGARATVRDIDTVADDLVGSIVESPDAMLWVARIRDSHQATYHHGLRVAIYLAALGRQMGFPRDDLVRLSLVGMLADVGKTLLPQALLDKPGVLTPAEYTVIKKHVELGLGALRKSMTLDPSVEQGILQHHERLDGSGYPGGLAGAQIGIYGRMAAIADCFAALTTDRPYAKAAAPQDALMQLNQWAGGSFHAALVEQFVQAIGIFPVGTLVELSNREVAIVVAHNRVRRLEPRVLVLTCPEKQPVDRPFERDLLTGPVDGHGQPIRIARGLPAGAFGIEPRDYYADGFTPSDDPSLVAA